jgi:two-component system, OmpR family, phosphate regulon sensor histidine kinase PhoR
MTNQTIKRVVLFGSIAIVLVIAMQSYWVMRTWNLNEKDFDRTVNIALLRVAQGLASINNTTLPTQNLVQRPEANYYVVNFNNVIEATNLEFYLRKELEQVSLAEDFEYGIYNCHDENMVYGKYISYTSVKDTTAIDKTLPTIEDSKIQYYFGVRFPKRTSYLLGNMSLTIFFSAIIFVTVAFFIYALMIILQQKRLTELQKDFINNMTHEFKTPISTVKIAADVFLAHPAVQDDSRLHRYAKIVREQNARLNNQVEKVLQLARIDRETLKLKLDVINLHELLDTVIPSIQVKVEEMNGTLTLHMDAKNPIIKADTLHLTNILHNLLDNAIKYCHEVPQVTIETSDRNGKIFLNITDKGIGIEKEHHAKVFDRFYRVPTGDVHNVKGFGLGLFYVKNIVQAHGWRVWLTSKKDEGTNIELAIPSAV